MTVILCGVAADTTNVDPIPCREPDGRFEYVPIPEKCPTTEDRTYGTMPRRHGDGPLADLLDAVVPYPGDDERGTPLRDPDAVAAHPPHVDPDFAALTYGDHRPGYVDRLRTLDPGDGVVFYAGLRDDRGVHRYPIGHLRVADVAVVPADADPEVARAILNDLPPNAHARRANALGEPLYADRDVCVVVGDGGGLYDRAGPRLSRCDGGWYRLRDAVATDLAVAEPNHAADDPLSLQFKPAIRCDVALNDVRSWVRAERD